MDGDQHWTPALVRQWRAELPARSAAIERVAATIDAWGPDRGDIRSIRQEWIAYLHSSELDHDLRRYLFRLEQGRNPQQSDSLPQLESQRRSL